MKNPRELLGPTTEPDEISQRGTVYVAYYSRYGIGLLLNKGITLYDTSRLGYSFADGAQELHLSLTRRYSGRKPPLDFITFIFESRSKCSMQFSETPTQLSADGEPIYSATTSLAQRINTGFFVIEQSFVEVPFAIADKWSRSQQAELRFGKVGYSLSTAETASVRSFVEVIRDLHERNR